MGKKNLEQLYRDSFENYSEVPDPMVWQNIEATLDNRKEKKRVIPIWWRLGGVAALLAIMFYVFNPFGNPTPNNTNQEVITNTDNNEKSDSNKESTQDSLQLDNPTQLATEDEPVEIQGNEDALKISPAQNELVQQERASDNAVNPQRLSKSSSQIVEQNNSKEDLEKDKKDVLLEKQMRINEDAVVVATNEKDKNLQKSKTDPAKQDALLESQIKSDKDAVAMQTVEKDKTVPTESNADTTKKDAIEESFAEINKTKDAVAENSTIESKEKVDETKANEKQSIFDAIAEQQKEADDNFVVVADNSGGKWSVGPSIAPIFFGSNGEGSPIHSEFQGASKTGNVNLSYGLTVAYNIGKRLKIRSGVHRVDFGYDTNDVEFSSSVSSSTNAQIDNISYNSTSRNLVLRNSRNALPEGPATTADVFSEETSVFDGRMIQQFGYIEVPFELDYALMDKKFGINVIGGISSLFLVDNSIQLESPSQNLLTEMGEANNANSVNFSTNIGLGFNYDFSPKLQFNLEPVFKYQLNTFSETAGTFRPYSVGIYSGIRFNF